MHNTRIVSAPLADGLLGGPVTRAQAVAEHLRERIRRGELAPGERLRQNDIAAQLGVSSTPVREAFSILEREGLAVTRSHRGVVVFSPSFQEFEQCYEIRIPLECALLGIAIPKYTPADLGALRQVFDAWDRVDDVFELPGLNERFHSLLYAPARRPRLEQLVRALRDECTIYLRRVMPVWPDLEETRAQHEALYDACRRGDVTGGVATLRVHLEHSVIVLADQLRKNDATLD